MTERPNVDVQRDTLLHCLLYWEAKNPNGVYLTQPHPDGSTEDFTWAQVADQVRRMAAHLKSLDLPDSSHIALVGKNSAHWLMADLAIWMAGHVSVPLYPTVNESTASYVLDDSEARLIFIGKLDGIADTWHEIERGIPDDLARIALPMAPTTDVPQWKDIVAKTEPLTTVALPQTDELATIVYTSGSTGRPKGVMLSFGGMIASTKGLQELFQLSSEDRVLSYLPLAHVAERAAVEATSLFYGFHVYFANSLETFQEDLKRARPTLFFSVPRLWTKFYQGVNQKIPPRKQKLLFSIPVVSGLVKRKILAELGLNHVRAALTGSAPLSSDIVNWYRNLGLDLLDVYGMSENFGYSHCSRPGQVRVGYVGHSNPGVTTRLEDNGEILVKSPCQMMGYYKMPEKTAEDMTEDGFLRTGDMGEIDAEGRLRITGRIKELFKTSKGKYVAPAPIENRLNNHPAVEAACVSGANREQCFALLLLAEDLRDKLDDQERARLEQELTALLAQVNAEVEHHEQVAFLVVVPEEWSIESGFLTPTMKIKRNVIEDHYVPKVDEWAARGKKLIWAS